jgi:phosphoglycerol transferase MdoB-like AlkP superfamily enzyme
MKKIISGSILLSLLVLPVLVGAEEVAPEVDVMEVMDSIINWLFSILLIIAAIFIIIAAYLFVTAMGDADKTKTARNFVLYALIGVLVAFCAKGLVELVRTIVGG